MLCKKCGCNNDEEAKYCMRCGSPLISDEEWIPAESASAGRKNAGPAAGKNAGQTARYSENGRPAGRENRRPGNAGQDPGRRSSRRQTDYRNNPYAPDQKPKDSSLPMLIAAVVILALTAAAGFLVFRLVSRNLFIDESKAGRTEAAQQETGEEDVLTSQTDAGTESAGEGTAGQESAGDVSDGSGSSAIDYLDDYSRSEGGDGTAVNMEPIGPDENQETPAGEASAETGSEASAASGSAVVLPPGTTPDFTGYNPARIINASATSSIQQDNKDNSPDLIFDGRDDTSWQEGVSGYGIGESVSWELDREYQVKYIGFKMGNWADNDYYYNGNTIPRTVELTAGGSTFELSFSNERAVQWVELSPEITARSMSLTIRDVYPGTSWSDTCISEIMVLGR